MQVRTGTVKKNYKESVKRFLYSENAYSFTSSVKDMPVYWKRFISNAETIRNTKLFLDLIMC